MDLEVRHLRLVQAIASEGTQTRAARKLFLTQSALSHQLADVERRVGTPLFSRLGRRMTLTQAGRRVLEASHVVLPQLAELATDLRALSCGLTGLIRITTQCYTCYHWLPAVLPAFRERFPNVEVRIVPEVANHAIESLEAGEIDMALAYDFEDDNALTTTPLWEDELIAIVHPEHRLVGRTFLEASDFAGEHLLIHMDRIEDTYFYHSILEPAGVRPQRTSSLRLTEGIVSMVAGGAGVAVVTRWTVVRELAAGQVIGMRVTELGLRRSWHALRLASERPDLALDHLADLMRGGPLHLTELIDEAPLRALAGVSPS